MKYLPTITNNSDLRVCLGGAKGVLRVCLGGAKGVLRMCLG